MSGFREHMEHTRARIVTALEGYARTPEDTSRVLFTAMRYSLLPPGKCVRPVLLMEFTRVCGGKDEAALPFACALEMIHTYSLIHDDLPCMDNDAFRRGRPSNHMVYGEAMALLAGSSLLSLAFETMLSPDNQRELPPERALHAAYTLAKASGASGMAGGQAMEMTEGEKEDLPLLYARKTGALFTAAAEAGCILAGADKGQLEAARRYADALGFAFQLEDDLLDGGGEHSLLKARGKDWCRAKIEALTREALDALTALNDTAFLAWLAQSMSAREN